MSQITLELAKSIYRSEDQPDQFVLTEDQFEHLFSSAAAPGTATRKSIPLAAVADKSVSLTTQAQEMRFEELSNYFTALCEGKITPKFLPYDDELPRSLNSFASFPGNPYPRAFPTPFFCLHAANVLDPQFTSQRQQSGLAYEYSHLVNFISYLYDTAFLMSAMESNGSVFVHTSSEEVDITKPFRLCVATLYMVLSWAERRAFEVKSINSTDATTAAVAQDYFRKFHLLKSDQTPRALSEHQLGLQRALVKHSMQRQPRRQSRPQNRRGRSQAGSSAGPRPPRFAAQHTTPASGAGYLSGARGAPADNTPMQ